MWLLIVVFFQLYVFLYFEVFQNKELGEIVREKKVESNYLVNVSEK